ncbi:hypothetical protein KQI36_10390 [Clostridium senegalense]|uniref:hypothetical protein n=1 Tax=Clostridium senegalense TaxID=1465809 RepID=UPI001C128C22|nr:hypothetical protein [Clostridium senegalense]MBU5227047.1 hypothetical protein [Clostridium senegalense]
MQKSLESNKNLDDPRKGDGGGTSPEKLDMIEKRDFLELNNKVMEVVQPYCNQAREVAKCDAEGRAYTGHTEKHVVQVAEKSQETADALESVIGKGTLSDKATLERNENEPNRVNFGFGIDRNILETAALSHDTGMSGGYKITETNGEDGQPHYDVSECKNFNDIRSNHSLNSAINVLGNREQYNNMGFSNEQVDIIAAECMAHSKSNSGVKDLNSKEDWGKCFDKIDATVQAYNEEYPGQEISFNRSAFEQNYEKLGQLATSALALRIGDVSRDSHPNDEAQSGEKVHVDRSTINDNVNSRENEVANADVKIADDNIESQKSREVHVGEQNITENHTSLDDNGKVTHKITINDMNSGKLCTQAAIQEHIGEMGSDGTKGTNVDARFDVNIKFDGECSESTIDSYDTFRDKMSTIYENVQINYPWDKEE